MAQGFPHLRWLVLLGLAGAFIALVPGELAAAAVSCRQQIIADWSNNGRVDRVYPLDCYQQAIEAMAPDIRDYTDAQEKIELALTLAVRKKAGTTPAMQPRSLAAARPIKTSGSALMPLPLVALGALGAAALAAGGLTYAGRRAALGKRRLGRRGGAR
jgi:hypothetical protein